MNKQTKNQPTKNLAKTPSSYKSDQLTFADHVYELRRRLMIVVLFVLAGSMLAYSLRHHLIEIILAPLEGQQLVYLTPGGGFSFIFQITIYAGLIMAAPVLVYQLHSFLRPALPAKAQKSAKRITLLASLLIMSGVSYGYYVAIPSALKFLGMFAEGAVMPNLTAEAYLSFFLAYAGGLALLSLVPLIVMFWHWIKPLTPGGLLKSEQWVVLLAFIGAAIITPTPDLLNQAMIAVPIIVLYQVGATVVLINILRSRYRHNKERRYKSDKIIISNPVITTATQKTVVANDTPTKPIVQKSLDGFVTQQNKPTDVRRIKKERQPSYFESKRLKSHNYNHIQPRHFSVDGFGIQ